MNEWCTTTVQPNRTEPPHSALQRRVVDYAFRTREQLTLVLTTGTLVDRNETSERKLAGRLPTATLVVSTVVTVSERGAYVYV